MPTPSVYIAVPSYQGIMGDTVSTIIYTMHDLAARGIPASFNPLEGHAILEIARAELVAGFLRSSASHMLFIDADTWFEASLVGRLLDADRDVVAVVSRSRRPPIATRSWSPRRQLSGVAWRRRFPAARDRRDRPRNRADTSEGV